MVRTFARVPRLPFLILLSSVMLASAQEQERKLLDRLLKPDMTLQNNLQDKQFRVADGPIAKKAPTKAFFVPERTREKSFWNTRHVSVNNFQANDSREARREANLSTRSRIAKLDARYSTLTYGDVRELPETQKVVAVSDFHGVRKFQGQGKSQRFLNAQHRPLTIEQVRELLNKN